ncbi:MAG: hypothetical protein ABI588_02050 [Arenimonas sp.]
MQVFRSLSASLALACALAATGAALALEPPRSVAPEAQARRLAQDYASLQLQRLSAQGDRDSLVAAALVGLADSDGGAPAPGHAEVLRRLLADHGEDELALYTVALSCQHLPAPCAGDAAAAKLTQLAPGNAVHWLLQPMGARPDRERLHSAASAGLADSHHGALLGIVRTALAGQQAPAEPEAGVDATALALALRRQELASIPWPSYGPVMALCDAAAAAGKDDSLRTDCANLGHALFSDPGQQVVTRMYGGTLLRRFAPGTQSAAEALAFRRQYLWLDQLRVGGNAAAREQLDEDTVATGEWEALQRQAERSGSTRNPPPDWLPNDRSALQLPEERRPGL